MIERCLGHTASARAWFRRALELNPHFSLLWAPVAKEVRTMKKLLVVLAALVALALVRRRARDAHPLGQLHDQPLQPRRAVGRTASTSSTCSTWPRSRPSRPSPRSTRRARPPTPPRLAASTRQARRGDDRRPPGRAQARRARSRLPVRARRACARPGSRCCFAPRRSRRGGALVYRDHNYAGRHRLEGDRRPVQLGRARDRLERTHELDLPRAPLVPQEPAPEPARRHRGARRSSRPAPATGRRRR